MKLYTILKEDRFDEPEDVDYPITKQSLEQTISILKHRIDMLRDEQNRLKTKYDMSLLYHSKIDTKTNYDIILDSPPFHCFAIKKGTCSPQMVDQLRRRLQLLYNEQRDAEETLQDSQLTLAMDYS